MNRSTIRPGKLAWGLSAVLLLTQAASAQEVAEMKPIRAAFPVQQQGCFVRAYDASHLAANPDQSVRRIRLARLAPELKREAQDGPGAPTVGLTLLLRTRTFVSTEALDCEPRYDGAAAAQPYLTCRSTCNRGSVDLTPLGPDSVRLTIGGAVSGRYISDAVGVGGTCAFDTFVIWLGDREGDRSFLLARASPDMCR